MLNSKPDIKSGPIFFPFYSKKKHGGELCPINHQVLITTLHIAVCKKAQSYLASNAWINAMKFLLL